jgi:hypothetical protein
MKTKSDTKRQLAIRVAKDVLKQIRRGKIVPTRGTYLSGTGNSGNIPREFRNKTGDLQKVLKTNFPRCRVCGIGAAFLGIVHLENKFDLTGIDYYISDDDMRARLSEAFSSTEMCNLENTFEGIRGKRSAKDTLIDIMKNIIKNEGVFVPAVREIYG